MNGQCDNQHCRDFAKMSRRVCIEVAGRARGTNVMNIFADEEEQRVSGSGRQRDCPPITVAQTFGQNRKERYAKERRGYETTDKLEAVRETCRRYAGKRTCNGFPIDPSAERIAG